MKICRLLLRVVLGYTIATLSSGVALGQAAYLADYHWIYGNGSASLGDKVDSKGFWSGNQTGVNYGYFTVRKSGPQPQLAELTFRSLSLVGSANLYGYCLSQSKDQGVDAIGAVGGGIAANCTLVNSGYGSFMSAWDFEDTTFDYELKCDIDPTLVDDGSSMAVRFGVTQFKHGLRAVFDQFDDEWDVYGWFWTPGGTYSWIKLPNSVKKLDYSLTRYGGPIGWGQLTVAENVVRVGCTAVNFGTVRDASFRAVVIAK